MRRVERERGRCGKAGRRHDRAWVGYNGLVPASTVPGGLNNITGNDGKRYAVQSLWSNDAAAGTGWCAGAGDDLPTG